jgi:hypothetical protein
MPTFSGILDIPAAPLVPDATVNKSLDDALALAISNGSGTLFVPPGEFTIKAKDITSSLKIVGIPGLSTLRVQNDDTRLEGVLHIDYTGSAGSELTVTAVPSVTNYTEATNFSAYRDKTFAIPVSDASGLVAGDWVALYSKSVQHPYIIDTSNSSKEYLGEAILVDRVIGNTIYTHSIPYQSAIFLLQSASNLFVRRYSRNKFEMRGVTLKADGNTNTWVTSCKRNAALQLSGVTNFTVELEMDGSYSAGILLKSCCDGDIKVRSRNLLNLPANGAYGYTLDIYGMCHSINVDGIYTRQGRHSLTSNTLDDVGTQLASKWFWLGQPVAVVIANMRGFNGYGNDGDNHQSGRGWVFKNCSSFHPRENSYAVRTASIVNITAPSALTLADSHGSIFNEILTTTTGRIAIVSTPPNNATVTVNGTVYTFKTTATLSLDVQISGTTNSAINLAAKIIANQPTFSATAADGYVPASTIIGKGIQIRAPGTVYDNFTQEGGTSSISMDLWGWDHGADVIADPRSRCTIMNSAFRLYRDTGQPHFSIPTDSITNVIPLLVKGSEFFGGNCIIDTGATTQVMNITFDGCTFAASDDGFYMFDLWAGVCVFKNCRFDMRYNAVGVRAVRNRGNSKVVMIDNVFDYGGVVQPSNAFLVGQDSVNAILINGGGNRVINTSGANPITNLRDPAGTGTLTSVTAL